jgi:glycosyltransferase EpsF
MRRLAAELGIEDLVRFVGPSQDVAAYMAIFDLFLFPSLSEGLGIVCVEAQAAGTRVLASDTTPREAAVVPGAMEFLSLDLSEEDWARHAIDLMALPAPDPESWRELVEQSVFGLDRCISQLHEIYRAEVGGRE